MVGSTSVALILLALAMIFLGVTVRSVLIDAGKLTPARKTWLLIALIFSAIAIVLQAAGVLFPH
jgi:hypothetical protein